MKKLLAMIAALLVLVGLYLSSLYNYLLFHSLAEMFSIIIGCGIFMVAWNSRRHLSNHFLLFIGVAYLFVSILDLLHMFAYEGMNLMPSYDANTPTQLWVAARYLEGLTLLAAPVMLRHQFRAGAYLFGYAAVTSLLLLSIFHWRIFPDSYLENAGGLTAFKKISEYIICLILVAAGALIIYNRDRFSPRVANWLLLTIATMVVSELTFTTYAHVYGFSNLLGHYLKILSFYFIYKAIIETGLSQPFELLFRDIKVSKDRYQSLFEHMINGFARHEMILDTSGTPVDFRYLEANAAFENLTGLKDVVGKRVTEIMPRIREEAFDWIGTFGRVAQTGESIRMENFSESLDKWFSIIAYSPTRGQFVAIFEDISKRKRAEEALRAGEARFKLLSDTAGQLLATEDPQGLINDLCREVMTYLDCQVSLNFLLDESSGRLRLNAWHGIPDEAVRELEWQDVGAAICGCVARDKRPVVADDIQHSVDPNTRLVKAYGIQAYCCYPLMVQGRLIGTLSFGTVKRPRFAAEDVELMQTVSNQVALAMERIQAQLNLRRSNEALESKVRERTAALLHSVDTLQEEINQRKRMEEELRRVNEQLNTRAAQLRTLAGELTMAEQRERKRLSKILHDGIQQHLAAAKMRVGFIASQIRRDDLKGMAEDVESMIGESIQMSRSLSADLSPSILHDGGLAAGLEWLGRSMREKHQLAVDLDLQDASDPPEDVKILLFEAVRELLFNAVKHAGVSSARVGLKTINNRLQISVSDSGKGFDADRLDQDIKTGGGIGLFSIRERIGLIGGVLEIDSAVGHGSRFSITVPDTPSSVLPMVVKAAPPAVPPAEKKPAASETELCIRVMIADDHFLFRDGLARLVDREPDMRVIGQACDGREAIDMTRQLQPDVVLMDVNMPVVDGIEATRRIHREFPDIQIIGLSMYTDQECADAMRDAGAADYRNKGCATPDLIAAIRAGYGAEPHCITSGMQP